MNFLCGIRRCSAVGLVRKRRLIAVGLSFVLDILRRRLGRGGQDGNQFQIINERFVGTGFRGAVCAVRQFGGDKKTPLGTGLHQLKRFRPTLDNAAEIDDPSLRMRIGGFKLNSIDPCAAEFQAYPVCQIRTLPVPLGDDLVPAGRWAG